MGALCYLPEVIAAISAAGAVYFVISLARALISGMRGTAKCPECRGTMHKEERYPYLFLLPVSFGESYTDAENYLKKNMEPIASTAELPSGRRAVRAEVYICETCGAKQVEFTDFLLVRGNEDYRGSYTFAYEPFASRMEEWKIMHGAGGRI